MVGEGVPVVLIYDIFGFNFTQVGQEGLPGCCPAGGLLIPKRTDDEWDERNFNILFSEDTMSAIVLTTRLCIALRFAAVPGRGPHCRRRVHGRNAGPLPGRPLDQGQVPAQARAQLHGLDEGGL